MIEYCMTMKMTKTAYDMNESFRHNIKWKNLGVGEEYILYGYIYVN